MTPPWPASQSQLAGLPNLVVERTAHPTCFFPCHACVQVGRRSPRAFGSRIGRFHDEITVGGLLDSACCRQEIFAFDEAHASVSP
jgi:hypothetical protein